jgi:Ni/Fe-hydrogenase 1 B-type cytochrome subunit
MSSAVTTREEHPWPARAMHWLHLLSMIALTYTGFYIHRPFGPGTMGFMRTTHFIAMFVLIFVAILRVYWAFAGGGSAYPGQRAKVRDSRHFGRSAENKGKSFEMIKYYLFMRKTHPHTAKYNIMQKGTYLAWLALIVLQAITGFALWSNTASFFSPLTYAVGGPEAMRMLHYLIMWIFIITTAIHVYLSVAEGARQLPLMFFGKESGEEPEKREIVA